MSILNYREAVLGEVRDSLLKINRDEIDYIVDRIRPQKRIFCDAAGRSRLQIEGFAMRLIQMGFRAYIVGDPTTPALAGEDILLTASASGKTPMLVEHEKKANEVGAETLLITASRKSPLAEDSDFSLLICAPSKKESGSGSVQPMGSLFEQSLMLLLDTIILQIMDRNGITSEAMYSNHANLE